MTFSKHLLNLLIGGIVMGIVAWVIIFHAVILSIFVASICVLVMMWIFGNEIRKVLWP